VTRIPPAFTALTLDREGDAGRRWLESLPALIADLLASWHLEPAGGPMHGQVALVLPVRRHTGEDCMLKISWPDEETRHEPTALHTWAVHGAVMLLAVDHQRGAMLLERLDASTSLQYQPIAHAAGPDPSSTGRRVRRGLRRSQVRLSCRMAAVSRARVREPGSGCRRRREVHFAGPLCNRRAQASPALPRPRLAAHQSNREAQDSYTKHEADQLVVERSDAGVGDAHNALIGSGSCPGAGRLAGRTPISRSWRLTAQPPPAIEQRV